MRRKNFDEKISEREFFCLGFIIFFCLRLFFFLFDSRSEQTRAQTLSAKESELVLL